MKFKFLLLLLLSVFQIQSAQAFLLELYPHTATYSAACTIETKNISGVLLLENRMDSALILNCSYHVAYTINIKGKKINQDIIVESKSDTQAQLNKNRKTDWKERSSEKKINFDALIGNDTSLNNNIEITLIF